MHLLLLLALKCHLNRDVQHLLYLLRPHISQPNIQILLEHELDLGNSQLKYITTFGLQQSGICKLHCHLPLHSPTHGLKYSQYQVGDLQLFNKLFIIKKFYCKRKHVAVDLGK